MRPPVELIAGLGGAEIVKHLDGRLEIRGGTEQEKTQAHEGMKPLLQRAEPLTVRRVRRAVPRVRRRLPRYGHGTALAFSAAEAARRTVW